MADIIENAGFEKKEIRLNDRSFQIYIKQGVISDVITPRLAVVSYLPETASIPILQLCIQTIKKFTDTPYELWVCDNNSPLENIWWLLGEPNYQYHSEQNASTGRWELCKRSWIGVSSPSHTT